MNKSLIVAAFACVSIVSACTTPVDVSQPMSADTNKNAKFEIKNTASVLIVVEK